MPMFLSSQNATARVHPVHMINVAQCQVAANLWTNLISLNQ